MDAYCSGVVKGGKVRQSSIGMGVWMGVLGEVEESWRRVRGELEESWRRVGGELEESWRRGGKKVMSRKVSAAIFVK